MVFQSKVIITEKNIFKLANLFSHRPRSLFSGTNFESYEEFTDFLNSLDRAMKDFIEAEEANPIKYMSKHRIFIYNKFSKNFPMDKRPLPISDWIKEESKNKDSVIISSYYKNKWHEFKFIPGDLDFFPITLFGITASTAARINAGKRMAINAEQFNMSIEDWYKICLENPRLLTLKPERLKYYIKNSAKYLGISEIKFIEMGKKFPQILSTTTETLAKNIEETLFFLEIPRKKYIELVIKDPLLTCLSAQGIIEKTTKIAKVLSANKSEIKKLIQKYPRLITKDPATIEKNIRKFCEKIGIQKEDYIKKIVYIQPSLTSSKPETVYGTYLIIRQQFESDDKTMEFLNNNPTILAYAQERLLTLFMLQKIIGLKTQKTGDPFKQLIKMNKNERFLTSEGELKLLSIFSHLAKIHGLWKKEIDPMRFKIDF